MNYCIVHDVESPEGSICLKCAIQAKEDASSVSYHSALTDVIEETKELVCSPDGQEYRRLIVKQIRSMMGKRGES